MCVCQTFLEILGRANVWATASPGLSLKIQLSFFKVPLSSSVPSGCEHLLGADTEGQEPPREIARFRTQGTEPGLQLSMEQCANYSDGQSKTEAQYLWQTLGTATRNAAEYTRIHSQTLVK